MFTARHTAFVLCLSACVLIEPVRAQTMAPASPDGGPSWAAVQAALGGGGRMQPDGVLRFGFPRTDLRVTVDSVVLRPTFALGSWIAFRRADGALTGDAMVMGDLVLTEDEVNPVMLALQEAGVEQTALHNHVLHESPRIMYMHIGAHGDPEQIARAIRAALGKSRTPIGTPAAPASASAAPIELDTAGVARILGVTGRVVGGVYQVSAPRVEQITEHGMSLSGAMGVATAINFQPTGAGTAAITGDFVLTAAEVNPVIKALRANGILVSALHSHMLEESPRLFFMHFWANADALQLATGLRAALDRTAIRR